MSYEAFCGLWWNRERARSFRAMEAAQGIAFSLGCPDDRIFDAMADDEEEARFLKEVYVSQKRDAQSSEKFLAKFRGS